MNIFQLCMAGTAHPTIRIFNTIHSLDIAWVCVAVLCVIQYCLAHMCAIALDYESFTIILQTTNNTK